MQTIFPNMTVAMVTLVFPSVWYHTPTYFYVSFTCCIRFSTCPAILTFYTAWIVVYSDNNIFSTTYETGSMHFLQSFGGTNIYVNLHTWRFICMQDYVKVPTFCLKNPNQTTILKLAKLFYQCLIYENINGRKVQNYIPTLNILGALYQPWKLNISCFQETHDQPSHARSCWDLSNVRNSFTKIFLHTQRKFYSNLTWMIWIPGLKLLLYLSIHGFLPGKLQS